MEKHVDQQTPDNQGKELGKALFWCVVAGLGVVVGCVSFSLAFAANLGLDMNRETVTRVAVWATAFGICLVSGISLALLKPPKARVKP